MKNDYFGMHWTDFFPNEPVKDFLADTLITLFIAVLLSMFISSQYSPKKKRTVKRISVLVPICIYFFNIMLIVLFRFPFAIGGVGCLIIGLVLYYRLLDGVVDNEVRIVNHHENGTVSEKGSVINKQKVGVWTYYDDQGQFFKEIDYDLEREKSEEAFASDVKESEKPLSPRVDLSDLDNAKFQEQVDELDQLIQKEKKALFGSPNKQDIIDLLQALCTTKKQALYLIDIYEDEFGSDLIERLKSLSSSYRGVKEYMTTFIDLDIVTTEHPHERKEK